MSKTVFLFSGQGSQYSGMGKELCEKYPQLNDIFTKASDILGFDLAQKCFYGTDEELSQTAVSQPAIMAVSLAAFEAMKINNIEFSAVAGHSLGEYAAMVAAEMLSLEDGFRIIKARAAAMQKAAEKSNGAMCAILGLDASEIEKVCFGIQGYVVPVNYNSTAQTVIAGDIETLDKAIAKFTELGAKAIKLNVKAAFHSKLMQPAADEFLPSASKFTFNPPKVKFFSNITGDVLTELSDMPYMLSKHIISPVRFTTELAKLNDLGYTNYVELGPNKVLTGLVKKTLKGVNAVNVENVKTLEKALESLV